MRLGATIDDGFTDAERHAMRLDGDAAPHGHGWVTADAHDGPALRASTLASVVRDGLVVERASAAWVWSGVAAPPLPELCTSSLARVDPPPGTVVVVREVVIDARDTALVAGVRVTTPLRTVLDLARFGRDADAARIRHLADATGLSAADCRSALAVRSHLSFRRRGRRLVDAAFADQPALTR